MATLKELWINQNNICIRTGRNMEFTRSLDDFPKLKDANNEQRNGFEITVGGYSVHWKTLDITLHIGDFLPYYYNEIAQISSRFIIDFNKKAEAMGITPQIYADYILKNVETIANKYLNINKLCYISEGLKEKKPTDLYIGTSFSHSRFLGRYFGLYFIAYESNVEDEETETLELLLEKSLSVISLDISDKEFTMGLVEGMAVILRYADHKILLANENIDLNKGCPDAHIKSYEYDLWCDKILDAFYKDRKNAEQIVELLKEEGLSEVEIQILLQKAMEREKNGPSFTTYTRTYDHEIEKISAVVKEGKKNVAQITEMLKEDGLSESEIQLLFKKEFPFLIQSHSKGGYYKASGVIFVFGVLALLHIMRSCTH